MNRIGIIGAGQMGGGIAHVCALAGYDVQLLDMTQELLDKAVAGIDRNISRQVSKGKVSEANKTAALARIETGTDYAAFSDCDLVIEAATENEEDQAGDLQDADPASAPGRADRHQHLVDLDHPAGRHHRPAGTLHRHAFHEPGAGDAAGGDHPRHRHRQ